MKLVNSLILILPLTFLGCEQLKVKQPTVAVDKVDYSQEAKELAELMKDVSIEDKKLIYAQFAGLHQYMTKTGQITKTTDLNKIFESFQKDYGYTREKYKAYTDKVESMFLTAGMLIPKSIVVKPESAVQEGEISRDKVLSVLKNLGDGAKLAMELHKDA